MAISALRLPPLSSSSFNFPCSTPNPNPNPNTRIFRLPKPSAASALDAKFSLLSLISHQKCGLKSQQNPSKQSQIVAAIEELALLGKDTVTTDSSLSGTWRLLWTTEKEQLFIINASWFGTKTGDVLQVIDVESGVLNNVITFPPSGVFFARFTSAVLRGENREIPLPPFGQGWFESVYLDKEIQVAKDIQGDYLVVDRTPYSLKE